MELSRQKMRAHSLERFKYIKTCVLARELCLLVRSNRMCFDANDAHSCCDFISKLCKEAGCQEPSDLCGKAAEVVLASEEEYLGLCEQSCLKCGESRQPARQPQSGEPRRNMYVA